MDDLGKLLLFRDVVDAGGFSHAAARRGLSHSTVSKHVRSLETALGVQLLNRTSRTMSLTEAGAVVLASSRRVGASVDTLYEQLDALRGDVVGGLRVNSLVHLSRHIVQPAIETYLDAHPRARVELVVDDGPLQFTRDGFDLAVRVGRLAEGSLTASKLLDNDVCIAAAPQLLARIDAPHHPEDLARLPTVAYRSSQFDISTWTYVDAGSFRSVDVAPVCTVNDGNALLDLVLSGLGIGYLSAFPAAAHLRSGALVRVLPSYTFPRFDPVFMIHGSTEHPSLKLQTFKRHLMAAARSFSPSTL